MLTGAAILVCATGLASATMIEAFTTDFPISGPDPNTDFSYSLTLPDFNIAGATLTGATIYLYAAENISSVTLTNLGTITQTSFSAVATSTIAGASPANSLNDSATGGTIYTALGGIQLQLFNQSYAAIGPSTGGSAVPACAPNTAPTAACSSVTFTGLSDNVINDPAGNSPPNNTQLGAYTIATGFDGVTGLVSAVSGGQLGDYTGPGSFTLSGATYGSTTVGGGGSISATVIGTGALVAEIDYTYSFPSGTPEPTTMALMGGALLGLGLLGKRFKKS
jgi:hypothetical protein